MLINNKRKAIHDKNAVSAGHDATAHTALEILENGGNAFDAAIAAFMTSFVAEPCMSSGGAGAFAHICAYNESPLIYDFFCQTPKHKNRVEQLDFKPIEVDFGDSQEIFHVGKGSTAVPGAIAGIFAMHEDLGSMPMSELVQPAIRLAKKGIPLNDFQALDLDLLQDIFRLSPIGLRIFFEDNELIKLGKPVRMPGLADFLDYMVIEGKNAFYKGEVANKIVEDYRLNGHLTLEDFSNYKVIKRPSLKVDFMGLDVYTNNLPSVGGPLICLAFEYTKKYLKKGQSIDEALYNALHEVNKIKRIPKHLNDLLLKNLKDYMYQGMDENPKKWGSTSHMNIIDKMGNVVSLTMTIGEGSGYFVEGTDIQMNNMLGESALLPHGFHSWAEDTRLSSMMSPTLVFKDDKLNMALGSGGASRIPSMIAQVINNYSQSLDLDLAIDKPRFHTEHGTTHYEPNAVVDEHYIKDSINAWTEKSLFFGGVHGLAIKEGQLKAKGDDRRDGYAIVR